MPKNKAVPEKRGPGRPVGAVNKVTNEIREWAQANIPPVKAKLIALLEHEDPRVQLKALEIMLNRAYGMPSQSVSVDGQGMAAFVGIKIVTGADGAPPQIELSSSEQPAPALPHGRTKP